MQNKDREHYEKLLEEKSEDWESTHDLDSSTRKKTGRIRKISVIILGLVIVSFAIWGFLNLSFRFYHNLSASHTNNDPSCACGSTLEESKSLGCIYDGLALAWLPPHCHDKELVLEFGKAGPNPGGAWKYWANKNRTSEYTVEELAELPATNHNCFYLEPVWHWTHCFYYWKKQYRSRTTGLTVEPLSDSPEHLVHCEDLLLKQDTSIGLTVAAVGLGGFSNKIVGACDEVSGSLLRIESEPCKF